MSCSKPLPPFTSDVLCYMTRDQLERFSIVCRPLKNFIARHFQSKPYRVFDQLYICEESYALRNNCDQDDYRVQKILAGGKCNMDELDNPAYYSFSEIRPYLGPTVRIKEMTIFVGGGSVYNSELIEEMESIAYLWRNGEIHIDFPRRTVRRIEDKDWQSILNSKTILQCRALYMERAHFSFKDYEVFYTPELIQICYSNRITDSNSWLQFLEQPGVKPLVVLRHLHRDSVDNVLDQLSKAFSSAISLNAFKIVFAGRLDEELTEFRVTNETTGEILELKEGLPSGCRAKDFTEDECYTLERSRIIPSKILRKRAHFSIAQRREFEKKSKLLLLVKAKCRKL